MPMQARHARSFLRVLTVLVLIGTLSCPLVASNLFVPEPKQVYTDDRSHSPWERVELLFDPHAGFRQETFATPTQLLDPFLVKWFGDTRTPHSGNVLLHCARNYSGRNFKIPVLLVHGAGDNANRGWIHPFTAAWQGDQPPDQWGFATLLSNLGYSVFAVTFAHSQGDNFLQAEHVANAIRRIRVLLKRENDASFQIDVIGHSKGNVAVRLYASDGAKLFPKKTFLTPYRNDIRRYIAIASPFRGIDTPFRYYLYNLTVADKGTFNAPTAADMLFMYGTWRILHETSLFPEGGNPYPGQAQILYNLVRDADVPLGLDSVTPGDGNLTMTALYHGGLTFFAKSRGIDAAIEAGERLIYRLEEQGLDPRISLGVIAGKNPAITWYVKGLGFIPLPHELMAPPGDGVLPLASSTSVKGALRRGAKLLGVEVLDLNHLGVACREPAFKVVDRWLLQP